MKLYPTIEEVFEQPIDFYKTVFFPLLTIDLANINKGNGKVHFVQYGEMAIRNESLKTIYLITIL